RRVFRIHSLFVLTDTSPTEIYTLFPTRRSSDLHSGLGEESCAGPAHRPESLDHGPAVGRILSCGIESRDRRGGHAESSDELVLGHAVDDGREGGRRPGGGRLGVGDELVDGGQSGAESTAGEDLVDVALPNAEVFP